MNSKLNYFNKKTLELYRGILLFLSWSALRSLVGWLVTQWDPLICMLKAIILCFARTTMSVQSCNGRACMSILYCRNDREMLRTPIPENNLRHKLSYIEYTRVRRLNNFMPGNLICIVVVFIPQYKSNTRTIFTSLSELLNTG